MEILQKHQELNEEMPKRSDGMRRHVVYITKLNNHQTDKYTQCTVKNQIQPKNLRIEGHAKA